MNFRLEAELAQVAHALRVQNAVQVIAFVLHHAGQEAVRFNRLLPPVQAGKDDRHLLGA